MDHSVPQHIGIFGEKERHPDILLDQQQGHAVAADPADRAEDVEDDLRRQRRTRFVEQHHLRLRHQSAADAQHLQFTAGQGRSELPAPFGQAREELVDLLERPPHLRPVADQECTQAQILFDRHARIGFLALGHLDQPAAHDPIGTQPVDALAAEANGASPGLHEPGDSFQQRRLAGAVAAEEGHDLALPDLERDAVQDLDAAVSRLDAVELQHPALFSSVSRPRGLESPAPTR